MTHMPSENLLNLLGRLWKNLNRRRRFQFGLLVGLMLVSALVEVVSLGAVLPFLGILVAPNRVLNHPLVGDILQDWGITSADQLVLPLTVAFIVVAVMAGAIRILLIWASTRLAFSTGADIGFELYRRALYQPYWVHASQNSSEVISSITNKTDAVVSSVLVPLLTLVRSTVLVPANITVLSVIDPVMASVASVGFGVSYLLVTWASRRQLRRSSHLSLASKLKYIKPCKKVWAAFAMSC